MIVILPDVGADVAVNGPVKIHRGIWGSSQEFLINGLK
jgi:hypothetical protein